MIISLCGAVQKVFGFLEKREEKQETKQKQEKESKQEKELKNVCDNGTLQDLFDSTSKGGDVK